MMLKQVTWGSSDHRPNVLKESTELSTTYLWKREPLWFYTASPNSYPQSYPQTPRFFPHF
ncbi:hypothetical protein [Ignatzschineria cameli]|uniref:hypothetical protein n=1 Tax=Ignatzschineria cameli TaxID=2182793 RepID=UPI0010577A26|nr:hypothetical protein [Ignatzschineria cameli]